MEFHEEVEAFAKQLIDAYDQAENAIVEDVFESIVEGSSVTSAPGQPVRHGKLRDSWSIDRQSQDVAVISSDDGAAQAVEDDWNNVHFPNHGPHSVKLTIAGFERLAAAAVERVTS